MHEKENMLAHGTVLREQFYSPSQLLAIVSESSTNDLSPADIAMMAFAEKIVRDATRVTEADINAPLEMVPGLPPSSDVS